MPRAALERALNLREGDPLPESREEVEKRLEAVPGVRAAHVGGVCCYEGGYVLWIGIEENGAPRLTFREPPKGGATLPEDIDKSVDAFYVAMEKAVREGHDADDWSHGYSLMADPATRAIQQRFIAFAKRDLPILRKVLRTSASERERTHSAQVIAYAPHPRDVVPDLLFAVDDPSEDVRNAAIRSLLVMSTKIAIPPEAFVRLLNSPSWTDRNKSLGVLNNVTAHHRDAETLAFLKREALNPLIEAARWKIPGYADPALRILGRIGGMPEDAIDKAIARGDRETLIRAALLQFRNL